MRFVSARAAARCGNDLNEQLRTADNLLDAARDADAAIDQTDRDDVC